MQAAGRVDQGVDPERIGSSDMGNVSLVLPTIHPMLAICDDGVPGHSTALPRCGGDAARRRDDAARRDARGADGL